MKFGEKKKPGVRIGQGYDVHRLVAGRSLIIGGVEIPSELGLDGHSDADVLLHAIADALLGAAALGDIGKHFPNTDSRYKGISSIVLLRHVSDVLAQHRYGIGNVDATLVLERPKVALYVDDMRRNIARALGIDMDRVSVKATTGEGLGFVGKEEGAAAMAVAVIYRR